MNNDHRDHSTVERLRRTAVRELRLAGESLDNENLEATVRRLLVDERFILSLPDEDALVQAVIDETLGLGPLEAVMRDPQVTEIMVVAHDRVYVERRGTVERCAVRFADDAHVLHIVDRILGPIGRRVDEANPMVDARLPDGSRVNVIIPPLSVDGPVITIRRFPERRLNAGDLVDEKSITADAMEFLKAAVTARLNILISGGTGSGKTTTLGALAGFIDPAERVVTIEDAAELLLPAPHVVRLESRPGHSQGGGEITIRALVRNALRMRPDRIVVGEVRGGEALDMLAAMTTGHAGSMSTIHAASPRGALRRLQLLASMADVDVPFAAVAQQVANAIDIVVHQERTADGGRRISHIAMVNGDDEPHTEPVAVASTNGRLRFVVDTETCLAALAQRHG